MVMRKPFRLLPSLCKSILYRQKSRFTRILKETQAKKKPNFKISVVGVGQVGVAISILLLARGLTSNLVLYDMRYDWAKAEVLDMMHGSKFLDDPQITACGNAENTKNSDIIIVTAGARSSANENATQLDIMQKSVDMLRPVIPLLTSLSPDAVYLITSNPCDIVTWAFQKIGKLEKHRCFTTGCHLDTARFHYLISERLKIPPSQIHGYVVGERGPNAVPLWSSVFVAGVPLIRLIPGLGGLSDEENWRALNRLITTTAKSVTDVKGYSNWAIALTAVDVVQTMIENSGRYISLGTDMKGFCCITDHVVLSLPCAVSTKGITHIMDLPMWHEEKVKLVKSANLLLDAQCCLKL